MLAFEILYFLSAPFLSYDTGIRVAAISAFGFFSLLLVAGRALGLLPENFFTEYAMQIGSGLEAFILALALADRSR
jgi:hypothetical protein